MPLPKVEDLEKAQRTLTSVVQVLKAGQPDESASTAIFGQLDAVTDLIGPASAGSVISSEATKLVTGILKNLETISIEAQTSDLVLADQIDAIADDTKNLQAIIADAAEVTPESDPGPAPGPDPKPGPAVAPEPDPAATPVPEPAANPDPEPAVVPESDPGAIPQAKAEGDLEAELEAAEANKKKGFITRDDLKAFGETLVAGLASQMSVLVAKQAPQPVAGGPAIPVANVPTTPVQGGDSGGSGDYFGNMDLTQDPALKTFDRFGQPIRQRQ